MLRIVTVFMNKKIFFLFIGFYLCRTVSECVRYDTEYWMERIRRYFPKSGEDEEFFFSETFYMGDLYGGLLEPCSFILM